MRRGRGKKRFDITALPAEMRLEVPEQIYADPVAWAGKMFGFHAWSGRDKGAETYTGHDGQAEVLRALFQERCKRLVCPTGHGMGKTYMTAAIVILWLFSHWGPPGEEPDSFVVMTAADWTAVRRMLFSTLQIMVGRLPPVLFRAGLPEPKKEFWEIMPRWKAIGLSPEAAESFQGWHSRHGTLVVVDEASHVTVKMWSSVISNLTGDEDAIVLLGNPLKSDGPFADVILEDSGTWRRMHMSSLDSPNIVHERTIVPGLASKGWLALALKQWPEGTPAYSARILGRVPDQDEDTFIAKSTLTAAVKRWSEAKHGDWRKDTNLRLGVDPARSEVGDETAFCVRGDLATHHMERHRGWDVIETKKRVVELVERFRIDPRRVKVDSIGVGSGVCDLLVREEGYPKTIRVVASQSPNDPTVHLNRRAESWARMKEGLGTLALRPEHLEAVADVARIYYSLTPRGQLQLERKEYFKERVGRSPDGGDALALTYCDDIGERAFPGAGDALWLRAAPLLAMRDERHPEVWTLSLAGAPREFDRPGRLLRASWLAQADESATVWVHVDKEGCWTVVDAVRAAPQSVAQYWRRVMERSEGHVYAVDVISGPDEGRLVAGGAWGVVAAAGGQTPTWIEETRIGGERGLARLNLLILSTLARWPDDAFWAEPVSAREGGRRDPAKYLSDEQLYIRPREVLEALQYARRESALTVRSDAEQEARGVLVAGGGPFVRAMRLLAVST